MTITKKKKDILGVVRVYLDHNTSQLKVLINYDSNGKYEVWVYIAQKPHTKFRNWRKLEEYRCNVDNYESIDLMVIKKALQAFDIYEIIHQEHLARLKKWREFIKNT